MIHSAMSNTLGLQRVETVACRSEHPHLYWTRSEVAASDGRRDLWPRRRPRQPEPPAAQALHIADNARSQGRRWYIRYVRYIRAPDQHQNLSVEMEMKTSPAHQEGKCEEQEVSNDALSCLAIPSAAACIQDP